MSTPAITIIGLVLCAIVFTWAVYQQIDLLYMRKTWKAQDSQYQDATQPMLDYLELLKETGEPYTEEGFRQYLISRGISPEQWRATAEALRHQ